MGTVIRAICCIEGVSVIDRSIANDLRGKRRDDIELVVLHE